MQYSDRGTKCLLIPSCCIQHCSEMSQLSFDHLLNLSFAWHTHRKTGEVLRVLDRGAAINHTLEVSSLTLPPFFAQYNHTSSWSCSILFLHLSTSSSPWLRFVLSSTGHSLWSFSLLCLPTVCFGSNFKFHHAYFH